MHQEVGVGAFSRARSVPNSCYRALRIALAYYPLAADHSLGSFILHSCGVPRHDFQCGNNRWFDQPGKDFPDASCGNFGRHIHPLGVYQSIPNAEPSPSQTSQCQARDISVSLGSRYPKWHNLVRQRFKGFSLLASGLEKHRTELCTAFGCQWLVEGMGGFWDLKLLGRNQEHKGQFADAMSWKRQLNYNTCRFGSLDSWPSLQSLTFHYKQDLWRP